MAGLLFVYSHSSIYAAKRNAERHRAADGGQISWYNENQRRHGALKRPEETNSINQLILGSKDEKGKVMGKGSRQFLEEELSTVAQSLRILGRENSEFCVFATQKMTSSQQSLQYQ